MTTSARPVDAWLAAPAMPLRHRVHVESLSAPIVWEPLVTLARSPRAGMQHFASHGNDRKHLHEALTNFVRQAQAYFSAAEQVSGTSSALLYYYAALQLAKAELLLTLATRIVGTAVHHGLQHNITSAASPRVDYLSTRPGIFTELYRKRTGIVLPRDTKLYIRDLIRYVPEIGTEASSALGVSSVVTDIYSTILRGNGSWWLSLLIAGSPEYLDNSRSPITRTLAQYFEEVAAPPQWKTIFGISPRAYGDGTRFYQGKMVVAETSSGHIEWMRAYPPARDFVTFLDHSCLGNSDAQMTPYLPRVRIPMTPALARYALMYYLSSLVRYKPTVLDPARYKDYAWVFESFCQHSGLHLLASFVEGVTGELHSYGVSVRA